MNRDILRREFQPSGSHLDLDRGSPRTQQRERRCAANDKCEFGIKFHWFFSFYCERSNLATKYNFVTVLLLSKGPLIGREKLRID